MMPIAKPALLDALTSVVGQSNVAENASLTIDGVQPAIIVNPASATEVAACLKVCAAAKATIIPAGAGTWLECGNPVRQADVLLRLERLSRVLEYSPPDLTITVEAGITLSAFNDVVRRERQWLPLDPAGGRCASLGAIVACASSGALRCGFGTPRDYIIGLKLAHADGTESRSGGKVVKNVAGYDLNKLYIGSYGTLALITELTLKLRPLPESAVTLLAASPEPSPLVRLAKQALKTAVLPASLILCKGVVSDRLAPASREYVLAIRFVDSEAAVRHQVEQVLQIAEADLLTQTIEGQEADAVWDDINDMDALGVNALRVSVPLAQTEAAFTLLMQETARITADFGVGILRASFAAHDEGAIATINKLRTVMATLGGSLMIECAPTAVRKAADAWGEVGATADLMRAVKTAFDPLALLNPGRFVSGI